MRSYRLNCPKLSAVAWFSRPGSQRRICDRHKPDELTKLDAITAEFVFFSVSLSLSRLFLVDKVDNVTGNGLESLKAFSKFRAV